MKPIYKFCFAFFVLISSLHAQTGTAINFTGLQPHPTAILDVNDSARGMLIPRIAMLNQFSIPPVTGTLPNGSMIFNTATTACGNASFFPGYYFWLNSVWYEFLTTNTCWVVGGNWLPGSNIGYSFGTNTNDGVRFVTNGASRGILSRTGDFNWGTGTTASGADLFNSTSNSTFPFAINGYTSQNGAGVYGGIMSGTTTYSGVLGEYNGTGGTAAGIRGIYNSTISGTSLSQCVSGVSGIATTTGTYKFGIYGMGGNSTISGGAFGYGSGGVANGSLGYRSSTSVDYSVYGFGNFYTPGTVGGMLPTEFKKIFNYQDDFDQPNNQIGLGIYGGTMGGWINGLTYGTILSGERFASYADGKVITNDLVIRLIDNGSDTKTNGVLSVSDVPVVVDRGRGMLINGEALIPINEQLKGMIDIKSLVAFVTPLGNCGGLYISDISEKGILVKENNNGTSSIPFNWNIKGSRTDINTEISPEILANDFDKHLKDVMHNENNLDNTGGSIWWDGENIRFDPIPEEILIKDRIKMEKYNKELLKNSRVETTN